MTWLLFWSAARVIEKAVAPGARTGRPDEVPCHLAGEHSVWSLGLTGRFRLSNAVLAVFYLVGFDERRAVPGFET
jgi:hypothetical protein